MTDRHGDILYIDLDAVLRSKLPRHYRYIPRFVVGGLKRLICQDRLNEMLEVNAGKEGSEFCRGVLQHLDVEYHVAPGSSLPDPKNPKVIIVSNHPLGGLDGMALIDLVARHYGCEPLFMVNDLLMAIKPLEPVFLPVNKHGSQSRHDVELIDEALASDRPVIIFPAGLVSRRGKRGVVADLQWKPTFVTLAQKSGRDIVPVFFGGRNSNFFYKFAQWRQRLGLKFNIEMALLPREVFRSAHSRYAIAVAPTVSHESLAATSRAEGARRLRNTVYALKDQINI